MTNPLLGFFKTLSLFLRNKVKFDRFVINHKLVMSDNATFTIFRRVVISSRKFQEAKAYFIVRFKPLKMSIDGNIRFSLLPMMIFMGFTGFRAKYWAVNRETGLCQGLYEWQTIKDAEAYSRSIAMKFMTRRSDPASVSFKIINKEEETLSFTIE